VIIFRFSPWFKILFIWNNVIKVVERSLQISFIKIIFGLLVFLPLAGNTQTVTPGLLSPTDTNFLSKDTILLQPLINNAAPGDTIFLKGAIYKGPAVISTNNVVIDGGNHAIVDAGNKGSVFLIQADSVTIQNMIIQNSGGSFDKLNSGVRLKGNYNTIKNCRIRETLFGIDIWQSNFNKIIHNDISSKTSRSTAIKGDAIRLWYSKHNQIIGNYWHGVRDMVVWYSAVNLFQENKGEGNRYGIHFMYSHNNRIQNNVLLNNSVGIFLMYSERTIVSGNLIKGNHIGSGMCIGMKETSSNQILNNRLIYSTEGIHIDVSPYVPSQKNTIEGNEIAFCVTGVYFHTNQKGNLFKHNYFHNNLTQVYPEVTTARYNTWQYNYWDDYEGFDKNHDNVGDVPYVLLSYVEYLWDFNPNVKFFFGAPVIAVLNFIERLAPFSKPKFVLEDKTPLFHWKEREYFKQNSTEK